MEKDIRGAFLGLQISIVGTALLSIWSHPDETASMGTAGAIVLLAGIVVTAKYLY